MIKATEALERCARGRGVLHPTEIIEFMIIGAVILISVIFSLLLKSKWRKIGWLIAISTLAVYCIFFAARPFWKDAQIEKKVNLLRSYLEEHYPDEEWVISTVPHREDGFKHLNPYYIGVFFESEPNVTYHYWVENKDNIYQISFSTKNEPEELTHVENRK